MEPLIKYIDQYFNFFPRIKHNMANNKTGTISFYDG